MQCSIEGVKIIILRRNIFCYFTLCRLDTSIVHVHVVYYMYMYCTCTVYLDNYWSTSRDTVQRGR